VLPFRNLGDDARDNYLADAISDDLTTDLSHIPGSVVIARESSDMYRGRNLPTAQIGRELNVRYLLEGSLRREEDGFSINAQLFEAATGSHVWAKRFKVPRDHIAETQETIVRRLASALGVTLVDEAGQRSLAEHAGNPDALDLFLRARSILDRSDTLDSMVEAQTLFEQALTLQPGYPDALSALSWLLLRKVYSGVDGQHDADLAEARGLVKLALVAAPNSAQALASHGLMLEADGQVSRAQASYETALSLDSGSVEARTGLIHVLLRRGLFEEAVRQMNDLLLIDPEGPRNKVRYHDLGYAYLMLGRPTDALIWLGRATAGDPDLPDRPVELGRLEWSSLLRIAATDMVGNRGEARALYVRYDRIWPHRSVWRLASNVARAQSSQPGFHRFTEALKDAGMPEFGDETGAAADMPSRGAFDPLPKQIPGVPTLDTQAVAAKLASSPLIVDYGLGTARLHGAVMAGTGAVSLQDAQRFVHDTAGGRAVIVMGDGPYDRTGYEAAQQLHRAGVWPLLWYRGGEEAWARAGMPSEDARAP
jgi:TolB-like protein/tetratricopeptide (TPR) repeat protein